MIREVNLIGHLPSYVQDYREIQGIMDAENPEFQLIEDASETIKDSLFVQSADEVGIERYENMFGLIPSKNDTLSDRQARVLTQYTNSVIYTLRGLTERLDMVCGVDNYTLELIPNEYKINIVLHLRVKKLISTITSLLADMIPANMLCVCSLNYNTHEVLAKYPHYILMQFTHQELREELIEDNLSTTCEGFTNYTMESFKSVSCENLTKYGMRKV